MEVTGKIKLIGKTETIGNNGFRKRVLVVTTDDQYPQMISVEFHQDKTDVLNKYKVGQNVTVHLNLRGREWISPQGETKYFNTIVGWRIEEVAAPNNAPTPPPAQDVSVAANEPDDLPF